MLKWGPSNQAIWELFDLQSLFNFTFLYLLEKENHPYVYKVLFWQLGKAHLPLSLRLEHDYSSFFLSKVKWEKGKVCSKYFFQIK